MKPTRASILSTTEEKFLLNQIAVLRKLQIKSLPDDKILHDFLSCVSPEKTLIAYKDTDSGSQISWDISKGFILDLEDSFFESPEKLQTAYEAVRSCFFENFLDENDLAELGSELPTPSSGNDFGDQPDSSSELAPENDSSEVDSDDELDLLSKVSDLDASTLSSDEAEIDADEFSNFSAQQSAEIMPSELEETVEEDSSEVDNSESLSEESDIDGSEKNDQTEMVTSNDNSEEENQKSDTNNEDSDNPASDEEAMDETSENNDQEAPAETVESEPSADPETEEQQDAESTDSEPDSDSENNDTEGPDFDNLAKQLADVGMETDKIDSLLSAVKSGKAPLETVQATIEKLKSAS